jgi:hypothetical protein
MRENTVLIDRTNQQLDFIAPPKVKNRFSFKSVL